MQDLPDNELLAQYLRTNSEEAFATLVGRHVNKVYSVAMRHVGNPHQAEEITQAVFVILLRKAKTFRKETVLSGWLYHTARLTAVTFVRSEIRRVRREQEAQMESMLNQPEDNAWQQLAPLLDDAVAKLGTTDRNAVVLRFLDGKSMREVGDELGISEDTAAKRISRAMGKLRTFFAKRGVLLSTTAICGAISANSVAAAPAQVSSSVMLATVNGATLTSSTGALVKEALDLLAWLKLKTAFTMIGVALVVAGGATGTVALEKRSLTAQKILERTQQRYSALSSYSDTWTAMVVGPTQAFDGIIYSNRTMLARPLLYRIETTADPRQTGSAIWSAGNGDFWSMSAGELRQERITATNFMPEFHVLAVSMPIACAFFNKRDWDSLPALMEARDLVRLADESIGGNDCYIVSATTKAPVFNITLCIGKNDFLIHQLRFVWVTGNASGRRSGNEVNASGNPPRLTNTVIHTHENITVNEKRAAQQFMPAGLEPLVLGQVVKRTIYDADDSRTNAAMIDLDSNNLFCPWESGPPLGTNIERGLARMRSQGIDLWGDSSGKTFVAVDMVMFPADQPFDKLTTRDLAKQRWTKATQPLAAITVQELPAVYLFKTSQGARGVLEITRFSTNLESMDFRYKLIIR
jgi:RNA polymerase sigma factor (sigma-70 family)